MLIPTLSPGHKVADRRLPRARADHHLLQREAVHSGRAARGEAPGVPALRVQSGAGRAAAASAQLEDAED